MQKINLSWGPAIVHLRSTGVPSMVLNQKCQNKVRSYLPAAVCWTACKRSHARALAHSSVCCGRMRAWYSGMYHKTYWYLPCCALQGSHNNWFTGWRETEVSSCSINVPQKASAQHHFSVEPATGARVCFSRSRDTRNWLSVLSL